MLFFIALFPILLSTVTYCTLYRVDNTIFSYGCALLCSVHLYIYRKRISIAGSGLFSAGMVAKIRNQFVLKFVIQSKTKWVNCSKKFPKIRTWHTKLCAIGAGCYAITRNSFKIQFAQFAQFGWVSIL